MAGCQCYDFCPCGARIKIGYPGNDPENGPARRFCTSGHTFCWRCGTPVKMDEPYCPRCTRIMRRLDPKFFE